MEVHTPRRQPRRRPAPPYQGKRILDFPSGKKPDCILRVEHGHSDGLSDGFDPWVSGLAHVVLDAGQGADRGLNNKINTETLNRMGIDYVFAFKAKGTTKELKEKILGVEEKKPFIYYDEDGCQQETSIETAWFSDFYGSVPKRGGRGRIRGWLLRRLVENRQEGGALQRSVHPGCTQQDRTA